MENETESIETETILSEYVEPANWKTFTGQYSSYWD
jgi:hypothetical protein